MSFRKIKSKSSKTLSVAQPIRKQTHQTLDKLEQQKRKYLSTQIQQSFIIDQIAKKKKQLNKLKQKQPQIVSNKKKQTSTLTQFFNTDKIYQNTLSNVESIKQDINCIRKNIIQYKSINNQLSNKSQLLNRKKNQLLNKINNKYKQKQQTKQQIINYRQLNIKNFDEFKKSYSNLAKSHIKQDNQRKKMAVNSKAFSGQQKKNTKSIYVTQNKFCNQGKSDMKADSIPIVKLRVNMLVHQNRQKIKIIESYMKFIQGLQYMFKKMRQYKGKDDIDDLTNEFVKKQKQIQKLVQYIGKLQYQIVTSKRNLNNKNNYDNQLEHQLKNNNQYQKQIYYKQINQFIKNDIQKLKKQSDDINQWFQKVGHFLTPLAQDHDFSKGNAINVIAKIQDKLNISRTLVTERKQQTSPTKMQSPLSVELDDHYHKHAEMLTYEKMKEFADEYLKHKKNVIIK